MRKTIATLLLLVVPLCSFAAEFIVNPGQNQPGGGPWHPDIVDTILIEGNIEAGDAEKLVSAIFSRKHYRIPVGIALNSRGGDVMEALKLASLVHVMKAKVDVINVFDAASNNGQPFICASACFFIFAAGERRTVYPGLGKVGMHRPYFSHPPGTIGNEIESHKATVTAVNQALEYFGVPRYLQDKMKSIPSGEIHWLSNQELEDIGFMSPAIEEIAVRECGYSRRLMTVTRFDESSLGQTLQTFQCMNRVMKAYSQKSMQALERGWRPWKP